MADDKEYVKEEVWKDYHAGDSIEGIIVDILHNVGQYNSTLYKFHSDDDKFIAVWGSTDINKKMQKLEVSIGMRVKITYNGLIRTENARDMKDFTVEIND